MAERRVALIYRETLFSPAEPWLVAQGNAMVRYRPRYLGIRRVAPQNGDDDGSLVWRSDGPVAAVRRFAWKEWGVAPATNRYVRTLRPAVVHAHFGRDAVQVLPLVRRRRLPLVVTFHGHDATRWDFDFAAGSYSDRLYLRRRGELIDTAARVLAVSSYLRGELLARGFPPRLVDVHYIGADCDAIGAESQETEEGLVVFAGRLVPWKGCDTLITAAAALRDAGTTARLVIVGDGPERVALEGLARGLRVPAEFVGPLPQREVWRWLSRAHVVAVPSRVAASGWSEAFGLVALEAQAAGTPVVATDCGGLGEALAECLRTRLVPQADPAALARELRWFLADPGRAADMGARTRDWARRERHLAVQTRALEAIYDEVAA